MGFTRTPDTIMGVTETKSESGETPQDIGGVLMKPADYPSADRLVGVAAAIRLSQGTGKIQFCDYLDSENVIGEIEITSATPEIKVVELSSFPTVNQAGWGCISVKLSIENGGTVICLLAGVEVC